MIAHFNAEILIFLNSYRNIIDYFDLLNCIRHFQKTVELGEENVEYYEKYSFITL